MRLTDQQLESLIVLLTPKFGSTEDRRYYLDLAFGDETALLRGLIGRAESAEAFTRELVTRLNRDETRLEGGDSALSALLETFRHGAPKSDGLAAALSPLIAQLQTPISAEAPVESALPDESATPAETPGETARRRSRRRRRRKPRTPIEKFLRSVEKLLKPRVLIPILLVLTIVPGAILLALTADTLTDVQEALVRLQRVSGQIGNRSLAEITLPDMQRLQFSVQEVGSAIGGARRQLSTLGFLSGLNPDLMAATGAMEAAELAAVAANDILDGLEPALFYLVEGETAGALSAQGTSGERLIELLQVGQARFQRAAVRLEEAGTKIANLKLDNISSGLLLNIRDLLQYHQNLTRLNAILLDLPSFLGGAFGTSQPADYLILALNNDSLRPAGGLVSAYGWLRVRRFQIGDFGFNASTDINPNPLPADVTNPFNTPDWWTPPADSTAVTWDSSWHASFPQSAEMAAWYYDSGRNPRTPVGGVIALDLIGTGYLLDALGGIQMPGEAEPITSQNLRKRLYAASGANPTEADHRQFMARFYQALITGWQAEDEARGNALLNAVFDALRDKHLALYFKDRRATEIVTELGWAGAQTPPASGDYLMAVDGNLTNKSNNAILRQITYDVQIQADGSVAGRVAIAYDYSTGRAANDPAVQPFLYQDKAYRNMLQLFVKAGSTLESTDNLNDAPIRLDDPAYTHFVAAVVIGFDTSERFQFSYKTPALVEPVGTYRRYRLLVQKPMGALPDPVTVTVTLPANSRAISTTPEPVASFQLGNPILEFQFDLTTDQWVEIIYEE